MRLARTPEAGGRIVPATREGVRMGTNAYRVVLQVTSDLTHEQLCERLVAWSGGDAALNDLTVVTWEVEDVSEGDES